MAEKACHLIMISQVHDGECAHLVHP